MSGQGPMMSNDRELWREREGDYYANSIHVTDAGGIGINVGGYVIVKPLAGWHKLAAPNGPPRLLTDGADSPTNKGQDTTMTDRSKTLEVKRSRCAECGAWGPVNEYHPFAYCVLVKVVGEDAARANIDDVVAHGRKLERAHLQEGMAVVPVESIQSLIGDLEYLGHGSNHFACDLCDTVKSLRAMLAASPYGKAVVKEKDDE